VQASDARSRNIKSEDSIGIEMQQSIKPRSQVAGFAPGALATRLGIPDLRHRHNGQIELGRVLASVMNVCWTRPDSL
jgi:hypothetical protein